MTTCEKHGCPLKELLTSTYCPRCDEEAAVNVGAIMKHVYADGVELPDCTPKAPSAGIGWYHNYPVCGTDANGSDVDDMDVCMGMVVGGRHLHKVGLRQEALDALRNAQDTPQPDVCMGLRQRAPTTVAVAVKIESITMWLDAGLIDEATALAWLVHV